MNADQLQLITILKRLPAYERDEALAATQILREWRATDEDGSNVTTSCPEGAHMWGLIDMTGRLLAMLLSWTDGWSLSIHPYVALGGSQEGFQDVAIAKAVAEQALASVGYRWPGPPARVREWPVPIPAYWGGQVRRLSDGAVGWVTRSYSGWPTVWVQELCLTTREVVLTDTKLAGEWEPLEHWDYESLKANGGKS